ncbi:MAG: Ribose-phosphate pyrophosphokinase [Thermodesulfobacterium sp. 37_54]|uniref:Ribose-phosphate pyrophosphokinase n=2 Tax=Thermodesulfobacterium commune TaxID=1741 RepID=A0A075WRH4_9BACT|nr:ribose-phosphate pyrophosphokinase [Thermodesulfobacterium commune]KUJ97430.1 MAG: Ribose-phosphate pyrophosphokinase [Thermodesulfobacterium sp. 37_54]AIH03471.1 phosphoribosylpyrophosphate synthetase [Thermodesulfobacterium commune DSM 2178]KUK19192.1 MAG: Ribose-phosphate pyrophosphokinase [Thermodesulfobacterium commune]KUK38370.1 MAG: Ribose-phosphate pyrophosphokinase [Thermodesulfobacterium commune]HAA83344.1 ribose-phosphate pyrophosphokinase [Thermodesulfobacterium commune]
MGGYNFKGICVFSGSANLDLAEKICSFLDLPLGKAVVKRFSDGEIFVEIKDNIRGADVFIIQPTCPPVNEHLMELLIMIDAARRASARRITAVIPYYGYARQDRKTAPRTPISAKLVANLIVVAGARRVLTVDLHAGQIQGFFDIPVDHLYALPVFLKHIKENFSGKDLVIVSPDAGGVERAREYAKRLGASIAIIDKRRERPNESAVMHIIGEVKDKIAIIIDDMVDTAGTMCQAADAIIERGALEVYGMATHPVLSGKALERIANSSLKALWVSDTIPLREEAKAIGKIKVLSLAGLLAEAIRRIHTDESISSLFV